MGHHADVVFFHQLPDPPFSAETFGKLSGTFSVNRHCCGGCPACGRMSCSNPFEKLARIARCQPSLHKSGCSLCSNVNECSISKDSVGRHLQAHPKKREVNNSSGCLWRLKRPESCSSFSIESSRESSCSSKKSVCYVSKKHISPCSKSIPIAVRKVLRIPVTPYQVKVPLTVTRDTPIKVHVNPKPDKQKVNPFCAKEILPIKVESKNPRCTCEEKGGCINVTPSLKSTQKEDENSKKRCSFTRIPIDFHIDHHTSEVSVSTVGSEPKLNKPILISLCGNTCNKHSRHAPKHDSSENYRCRSIRISPSRNGSNETLSRLSSGSVSSVGVKSTESEWVKRFKAITVPSQMTKASRWKLKRKVNPFELFGEKGDLNPRSISVSGEIPTDAEETVPALIEHAKNVRSERFKAVKNAMHQGTDSSENRLPKHEVNSLRELREEYWNVRSERFKAVKNAIHQETDSSENRLSKHEVNSLRELQEDYGKDFSFQHKENSSRESTLYDDHEGTKDSPDKGVNSYKDAGANTFCDCYCCMTNADSQTPWKKSLDDRGCQTNESQTQFLLVNNDSQVKIKDPPTQGILKTKRSRKTVSIALDHVSPSSTALSETEETVVTYRVKGPSNSKDSARSTQDPNTESEVSIVGRDESDLHLDSRFNVKTSTPSRSRRKGVNESKEWTSENDRSAL